MTKRDQYEENDFDYCFPPVFRCQYDDNTRVQPNPKIPQPEPEPEPAPEITNEMNPMQPTVNDISYTQGYLRTQIGKRVKIDFLIGTNMLIDKEGTLIEVGISYVVIREVNSNIQTMCDIYSIKFVQIF